MLSTKIVIIQLNSCRVSYNNKKDCSRIFLGLLVGTSLTHPNIFNHKAENDLNLLIFIHLTLNFSHICYH